MLGSSGILKHEHGGRGGGGFPLFALPQLARLQTAALAAGLHPLPPWQQAFTPTQSSLFLFEKVMTNTIMSIPKQMDNKIIDREKVSAKHNWHRCLFPLITSCTCCSSFSTVPPQLWPQENHFMASTGPPLDQPLHGSATSVVQKLYLYLHES